MILDQTHGEGNLDREGGGGRIPNMRNSDVIREWIENGDCLEPFRALYPDQRVTSYIPFRGGRGGGESMVKVDWIFFL